MGSYLHRIIHMSVKRRTFLSTLSAFAGIAALRPRTTLSAQAAQNWDMTWLDGLNGKHKQVFDLSDMEIGLLVVKNWLDAWQDVYGLKHPRSEEHTSELQSQSNLVCR